MCSDECRERRGRYWALVSLPQLFGLWVHFSVRDGILFRIWYLLKKLRKSLRAPHPKDMSVFIEISNGKNVEFACSDYIRTPMLFLEFSNQ